MNSPRLKTIHIKSGSCLLQASLGWMNHMGILKPRSVEPFSEVLWVLPYISLQPCRTVKIQVGDILSSSIEVHLNINSRAADLLAQVHQDLCRSDSGKGLKRYSSRSAYITFPVFLHLKYEI